MLKMKKVLERIENLEANAAKLQAMLEVDTPSCIDISVMNTNSSRSYRFRNNLDEVKSFIIKTIAEIDRELLPLKERITLLEDLLVIEGKK